MVREEPRNTRTAAVNTNHSTMFTFLLELNVTCGRRWIQFELQNIRTRAFAIDGKIYTTSLFEVLYIHDHLANQ